MVSLVSSGAGALAAYPTAKVRRGHGVRASRWLLRIPQLSDGCPAGARHGPSSRRRREGADLVVIGSHCTGLDHLLGRLEAEGWSSRRSTSAAWAGSPPQARRVRHRRDPPARSESGVYNLPFLSPDLELIPGYRRMQGIVFRRATRASRAGRSRGRGRRARRRAMRHGQPQSRQRHADPDRSGCSMARDPPATGRSRNRTAPSPPRWRRAARTGAWRSARSRSLYDLGFLPLVVEHYDLVVPRARRDRAPIQRLIDLLTSEDGRELLRRLGFEPAVPPAG